MLPSRDNRHAFQTQRPFLCTGNSARSILAEAIFNRSSDTGLRAFSAGSKPAGQVHPGALELLRKKGFDIAALHSKSWDCFTGNDTPEIERVITLCDSAVAESCPAFSGSAAKSHWSLPDPAAGAATFEETWNALVERIEALKPTYCTKGRDDRAGFCPCAHDACVALAEGKHSPAYGGGSLCAHTGKRQATVRPRPLPARFVPGTTFVKMKAIEKNKQNWRTR